MPKIEIPEKLLEKLKEKVKQTDFKSIEEYIKYILEQVTFEDTQEQVYSKEEEEAMRDRLKDLGYI